MSIFNKLINRLHRVFNKEAYPVAVLAIACSDSFCDTTVNDTVITITSESGTVTIPIGETTTLAWIASTINSYPHLSATAIGDGTGAFIAKSLINDTFSGTSFQLSIHTSVLWSEMKTYGFALQEQVERIAAAGKELYADTADGEWLEYWLEHYYGIRRIGTETDAEYFTRAKYELFALKTNNKALQQLILDATGLQIDIIDLRGRPNNGEFNVGTPFTTNSTLSTTNNTTDVLPLLTFGAGYNNLFGVFFYTHDITSIANNKRQAVVNIIDKYRASGTFPKYFAQTRPLITNNVATTVNNKGYRVGPAKLKWEEIVL